MVMANISGILSDEIISHSILPYPHRGSYDSEDFFFLILSSACECACSGGNASAWGIVNTCWNQCVLILLLMEQLQSRSLVCGHMQNKHRQMVWNGGRAGV